MLLRIFISKEGDDAFTHFLVKAFVHFMAACLLIRVHVSFMSGLMIFVAVVVLVFIPPHVAFVNRHLRTCVARFFGASRCIFNGSPD